MKAYPLRIATPEGSAFSGEAEQLILRGAEGDLAVRAGHVPLMTTVRPCSCSVTLAGGETRTADAGEGILTVGADGVIVLLSRFTWKD